MAGRFRSGDHLKVRRPRGYHHHGIYISDDRVIQFGSGITLTDKSRAAVSAVTLAEFIQGRRDSRTPWLREHAGHRLPPAR
jgi:hypothetical protein